MWRAPLLFSLGGGGFSRHVQAQPSCLQTQSDRLRLRRKRKGRELESPEPTTLRNSSSMLSAAKELVIPCAGASLSVVGAAHRLENERAEALHSVLSETAMDY